MRVPKIFAMLAFTVVAACGGTGQESAPAISGRLEEGLRVLEFDPSRPGQHFTIYRGDYVRPEVAGGGPFTLEIPDLEVSMVLPVAEGERSYFKVPDPGVHEVRIGDWTGTLEAIEYAASNYREVDARQAARLIEDLDPFVLDVRTPREFAAGHLEGAVLMPVQTFAGRIGELDEVRSRPVFIYCRSGNRSTVAARLLVQAGFDEVINLRHGIAEWQRAGLPLVK